MHELKQRGEEWADRKRLEEGPHWVKGPKEKLLPVGMVTAGLVLMRTFR